MAKFRAAFTLVEILIVVVILAILAAIVVPQMVGAQVESQVNATLYDLGKIRRHVVVYQARNDAFPTIEEGDGTWGEIVGNGTEYLMMPPVNSYIGGTNRRTIVLGEEPDTTYHTDYGWIFNPDLGQVWAAGFDNNDNPLPKGP
ncbi:MAG: prepilin-type N-terminal cleavage/methylation domain-containing protein [Phycisphaeraceae bacterium]|nr:prepilin-type N-terminal cleavage/methylation domain-containing protein [Phycisphaeraceae bacterium]